MANGQENLIPFNKLTEEQHREIAKKGGEASVKAKKQKKLVSQALKEMILEGKEEIKIEDPETHEKKKIKITPELFNKGILRKALQGNTRAWELLMGYLEGKPVERLQGTVDQNININVLTEEKKNKLDSFLNES